MNYLPTTKIAALFDVSSKTKNYAYSQNIRAPFFSDIDSFLEGSSLDAVFISVPPSFNHSIIKKCTDKKINFFVEKPIADTIENAKEIVALAKKNKVKTSVGYMYAYNPLIIKAKEILKRSLIGKIKSFNGQAYATQVLSRKKGWRYNNKTAGGGCVNLHGSHLLYILYNLLGLPDKITSKLYFPYSEVEDAAEAKLKYDDFEGIIKISWSEPGYAKLKISLFLEGTNGSLEINEEKLILILKNKTDSSQTKKIIYKEDLDFPTFELGGEGYFNQDKSFIDSLKGSKNLVSIEDGLNVQKIIQAIYDAHNNKTEVKIS